MLQYDKPGLQFICFSLNSIFINFIRFLQLKLELRRQNSVNFSRRESVKGDFLHRNRLETTVKMNLV